MDFNLAGQQSMGGRITYVGILTFLTNVPNSFPDLVVMTFSNTRKCKLLNYPEDGCSRSKCVNKAKTIVTTFIY